MSATTTASAGRASNSSAASMPARAARVQLLHPPSQRFEPAARLDQAGQRGGPRGGVRLHHHIRQVVLRRVLGVDVHRDQVRRRGLAPALGHHRVEVRADGDHAVGVVPQRAALGHVRGGLDEAGVVGAEQPAGRPGGDHRARRAARPASRDVRAGVQRARRRPRSAATASGSAISAACASTSSPARGGPGAGSARSPRSEPASAARQVGGDLQVCRTRWRRQRRPPGLEHGAVQVLGRRQLLRVLHHRREHRLLVGGLVQRAAPCTCAAAHAGGHVGRDHQHGRARRPRLAHRAERVGRTRARWW